jgi:hypothetical protein
MNNLIRTELVHSGSYVSLPEAFIGGADAVKFAPKIAVRVGRFPDAKHPLGMDFVLDPHQILIDLEAIDVSGINADRLAKDCDLLKQAIQSDPRKILDIVAAFGVGVPHDRILDAAQSVDELGISEKKATEAGGGIIGLLIVLAAVAMASCKGCAHTEGSMRQQ